MIKDKRSTQRRQLRHTAWILAGPNASFDCSLSDVSESGARLEVEDSSNVPDRFFLLLSERGTVRRTCNVVWRKPNQLGVKFEHAPDASKKKPAATLQPEAATAAAPAPESAPKAESGPEPAPQSGPHLVKLD